MTRSKVSVVSTVQALAAIADDKALASALVRHLRDIGTEANRQGMQRFGINTERACGVSMATLRPLARTLKPPRHKCAEYLWQSGVHEARVLATLLYAPDQLTRNAMDAMVADIDSWDLCDQACGNLLRRVDTRWELAYVWVEQEHEFVRRAGFALVASMAAKKGTTPAAMAISGTDAQFCDWLKGPALQYAADERNFVKKAVHWSIRQIGKRNADLWVAAMACARLLTEREEAVARWVGRESLRELNTRKPSGVKDAAITSDLKAERGQSVLDTPRKHKRVLSSEETSSAQPLETSAMPGVRRSTRCKR
ncbi:armadillo-type protein [Thamnocephalis sphaerospora]|uniref:Armadillo-type protein n=1 Tax=Thamnocephalis sphaerospora TaxID=78915 RepID=A0A4P9XRU3_9FUNG|nr:armadillo-type protein [Thamnocephalis sphaerospora]|eukprot:RKP08824.1 armadillo-type protein [Thamnocephalis sphaerospora]